MEDLWPRVISEGGPRILSNFGAVGESGLPGPMAGLGGARRGRRPMGSVWQLVVKDLYYKVT